MRTLLLLGAALLLGSCGPAAVGGACVDAGDCAGVAICNAGGACQEVECVTSEQCPLRNHCDVGTYTCQSGCRQDTDCIAGEACSGGQCEPYGCRDTALDCHYGEICNRQTGVCDKTTQPHCRPSNTLGEQSSCFNNFGGAVYCWNPDLTNCYCLLPCQTNAPDTCPRGLECIVPQQGAAAICYGDCPFLIANQ